jgi:hypothetical protein
MNGGLGSTQILTQHCCTTSLTVSQLVNSGTMPTSQVPAVHPLRVIKTLVDGVGAQAVPPSDNLDGTLGLH